MENIQNNNATHYIPNRNEINITIEPSPHSINRNLMAMDRGAGSINDMVMMEASTSAMHMHLESMPTTASTSIATFDLASSISSFEPYHQLNELNAYQNDEFHLKFNGLRMPTATASESLNNYIDLDDDDDDGEADADDDAVESFPIIGKSNDDCHGLAEHDKNISAPSTTLTSDSEICHRMNVPSAAHEPIRHPKNDIELDPMDDDTISVEEALRALDFAISGGESILSDYADDSSSDNDDNKDEATSLCTNAPVRSPHDRINASGDSNDTGAAAAAADNANQLQPNMNSDDDTNKMPENRKCTELIEIADAKDKLIVVLNESQLHNAPTSHSVNTANAEQNREYVYEIAAELVDSVLEECSARIAQINIDRISFTMSADIDKPMENESHATVTADSNLIAESGGSVQLAEAVKSNVTAAAAATAVVATTATTSNVTLNATNLDDSLDETFIIGKLEASTPCHKIADVNFQREPNRMGVNLFPPLDEANESALSTSDIEPFAKADSQIETHIAYATFEVPHPCETQLAGTFVKNDDATFCAADTINENMLHDTFDVAAAVSCDIKPRNDVPRMNPTIKIDKDEANSDDLTTQTPMNTPIELNYVGDSWDQFVSKSMNTKSSDCKLAINNDSNTVAAATGTTAAAATIADYDDDSQQMTNLTIASTSTASKMPWFLHGPSQSNETFDVNDTDYSNYDYINDDSESIDDNPELLSLTFDALRKQLAESLPQASGTVYALFICACT